MICPECEGTKRTIGHAGFRPIDVPCLRCDGRGYVPEHERAWVELGRAFRQHRRKQNITLRGAAKLLNMSMTDLSAAERGQADPSGLIERLEVDFVE